MCATQIHVVAQGRQAVRFPREWCIATHRMKSQYSGALVKTSHPWGLDSTSDFPSHHLGSSTLTHMAQYFVILRRDLPLFCRGLEGADSGYDCFGANTVHALQFRPNTVLYPEMLDPKHANAEGIMEVYKETLSGFKNVFVHIPDAPGGPWSDTEKEIWRLGAELEREVRKHRPGPTPGGLLKDLEVRRQRGLALLERGERTQAAEIFARASQHVHWLQSRSYLWQIKARGGENFVRRLADLYFDLNSKFPLLSRSSAWYQLAPIVVSLSTIGMLWVQPVMRFLSSLDPYKSAGTKGTHETNDAHRKCSQRRRGSRQDRTTWIPTGGFICCLTPSAHMMLLWKPCCRARIRRWTGQTLPRGRLEHFRGIHGQRAPTSLPEYIAARPQSGV